MKGYVSVIGLLWLIVACAPTSQSHPQQPAIQPVQHEIDDRWVEITGDREVTFYVDIQTIRHDEAEDRYLIWLLAAYPIVQGTSAFAFDQAISRIALDCDLLRMRTISTTYRRRRIPVRTLPGGSDTDIRPGSMGESVAEAVCEYQARGES